MKKRYNDMRNNDGISVGLHAEKHVSGLQMAVFRPTNHIYDFRAKIRTSRGKLGPSVKIPIERLDELKMYFKVHKTVLTTFPALLHVDLEKSTIKNKQPLRIHFFLS